MKLKLNRTEIGSTYTIGKLYIDDVYFCDTLQSGTTKETITGGTYIITFTYYVSIKKSFPILRNIPVFGIAPINYGVGNFLDGNIIIGTKSGETLVDCENIWNSLITKLDSQTDITILIS